MILTFESADEILQCDHSNESYFKSSTLLWCSGFIMLHKVVLAFESVDKIVKGACMTAVFT